MITVDVSGGCDSTAVCLLYKERGIDFEMLFADTGAEFPENYWFLPRLAKYVGKKLIVVNNGSMFLWLVKKEYFLPSRRVRWCTEKLKTIPIANYYKEHDYVHAMGIRADEQYRIRDKSKLHKNEEILYPLIDAGIDKIEAKRICEKHDMLNPIYHWRTNVSCFCCPFQRLEDWRGLYKNHPELFMVAEQWEEVRTGFSWRSDKWTLRKIREELKGGN